MKEENRGLYIIGFMVLASLLFVTLDIDLTNVQTDSSIIDLGSIISLTGFTIQQKLLSAAILILIPVIIGLVFILRMMNAKNYKENKDKEEDISIEEVDAKEEKTVVTEDATITKENVFSNDEDFNNEIYDSFVKVQYAFMQFNYDALESLLSDKLFDKYKQQLKDLNAKKHKKIMKSFNKEEVTIESTNVNNNILTVKAKLKVNYIGYTLNDKSEVIEGEKGKKISKTYSLTLSKSLNDNKKVTKCPHCGNKLKENEKRCPNCDNDVVSEKNEWIFKAIDVAK